MRSYLGFTPPRPLDGLRRVLPIVHGPPACNLRSGQKALGGYDDIRLGGRSRADAHILATLNVGVGHRLDGAIGAPVHGQRRWPAVGSPWGTHGQVLLATDTETVAFSALTAGPLGASCPGVEVAGPPLGGDGGGPCGSFHRAKGTTTVTPAEIIYHRRVRLLSLADELGNVADGVPPDGHLPDPLLRVAPDRRPVRARGVDAQGAASPAAAQRHPTHVVEDLLTLAVVEPTSVAASTPTGSASAATASARRRCRSCSSTTASAAAPSASPARRRSRRRRPGCPPTPPESRAVRVLPLQPSSWIPGGRSTASTSATSKASARCTS